MKGTFQVLLVYIDAEEAYAPAALADELPSKQIVALEQAGAARSKSFLLLVRRNWELEAMMRNVRLPQELEGLAQIPKREVVDHLLGYWDGRAGWHPGAAGLQPAEARVYEMRVIERRSVAETAWALGVKDRTVVNHMTEANRKLRESFGLAPPPPRGVPFSPGDVCPQAVSPAL